MQKIFTLDDKIVQIPECSICLLPLNNDLGIIVDCGHVFHKECVASLKQNAFQQCPVCRVQMNKVCDIFYTIKIKDVQDEPKYMANMIQIITLKEEIEKLKQVDKDHRDQVLALQQKLSREDQKIQILRQQCRDQKEQIQDLENKHIKEYKEQFELYRNFGNITQGYFELYYQSKLLKKQQPSNSKSSEENIGESNDEKKQSSSNSQDQLEVNQNNSRNNLIKLIEQISDKIKLFQNKVEEKYLFEQSRSEKKKCLKEIQSFEKIQRQHK